MRTPRLPSYLRTHRRTWALTQRETAFLIGLQSGTAVSYYERRERSPQLRAVIAYELLFETSIRALVPGLAAGVERMLVYRARQLLQEFDSQKPTARIKRARQLLERIVARTEGGA
jgi:hypothetical protein